ncbi:MAG TPA: ABC transporter permease, partial [Leptospiraceae bacterium]|nr:ABC transporter permease [Leptospiraceae bacterium]
SPFQYFTGLCISQAVCGFLQLIFMLLISVFMGFRISQMNLIIFFISGILLIFASASMGVLLSGFIKDDSEALNAGSAVSMVQVFLSGAFFAFPGKILFMLKDTVWNVWDLIPATEAVLIWNAGFGYGISSIQRLVWLSVLAVIWYIFGYKIYELKEKK